MDHAEATELYARWLPAWTGNRPEELAGFYSDDVVYRDPARPDGVRSRPALLEYQRALLARFPDWTWTADAVLPIDGGFVLRWKARIPVGDIGVEGTGMDLVLVQDGLITRNEVYFDRTALLRAMAASRR
jgi:ketosteroid isomerase-like protein